MRKLEPINWNTIIDQVDLDVWNKLTSNFWLPEKVPIANDIPAWSKMQEEEKTALAHIFAGLTLLDTIQGTIGAQSMIKDADTPHEEAVLGNISFMEAVHAKSYSSIFSTLMTTPEINEAFEWSATNKHMQYKANRILDYYEAEDSVKKKIASVLLESFLFFSGFYYIFHLAANAKLTNSATVIQLILRDECFASGTALLTPSGWKDISEITPQDTVAQYDAETKTISFTLPLAVSQSQVDHTYTLDTTQKHIYQVVSENHRVVFEKNSNLIEIPAKDITKKDLKPSAYILNAAPTNVEAPPITAEERLLIAIQADGSFDTTTVNSRGELRRSGIVSGHIPAKFSFNKQRKIDRLVGLANDAGWDIVVKPEKDKRGRTSITLYVPVGYPTDKLLPSIRSFDNISKEWCIDVINEIALWDGHIVKENTERITYGSIIRENSEWVQTVATLAGFRTHFSTIVDNRKDSFSDYYRVQINKNRYKSAAQSIKYTRNDEPTTVYGVEVPSSYLLVKTGDTINISGNSVHGYYLGYKSQKHQDTFNFTQEMREQYKNDTYDLVLDLMENEEQYMHDIYDVLGLTDEAIAFTKYNCNKALMNLGYESLFDSKEAQPPAEIMSFLDPTSNQNHDFFSDSGSSYVIVDTELTSDDDWGF